ncbi:Rid family detoxifying hydrolase [Brochothrix campestris]|uniref:Rid family detoxifying hydrolase n=1 Tax=Brochothrix campestris TaxID=2757 RepID=UPI000558EF20|nr:Rid family detoxifying hydrolase [Brochothrix campestris]
MQTLDAPQAIGPYSQGQIVGDLHFFSGQIPLDPQTGEMVGETITAQTDQVMKNIKALLASCGGSYNDIVKATIFTTDLSQFTALNEAYAAALGDVRPARSCVEVAALPKKALVEIEIIAEIKK